MGHFTVPLKALTLPSLANSIETAKFLTSVVSVLEEEFFVGRTQEIVFLCFDFGHPFPAQIFFSLRTDYNRVALHSILKTLDIIRAELKASRVLPEVLSFNVFLRGFAVSVFQFVLEVTIVALNQIITSHFLSKGR